MLKWPLKTACYFSSNLSFSPWQSVGSTWSRQLPVLSARYEYLTVESPSNPSSIRLVWQVSRTGAPFTEKKIETKIAAANAGCRNKMKARQRKKILASSFPQHLVRKNTRNLKKNNVLRVSGRTLHAYKLSHLWSPPSTRSVFHLLHTPPCLSLAEWAIHYHVSGIVHGNTNCSAWPLICRELDYRYLFFNTVCSR